MARLRDPYVRRPLFAVQERTTDHLDRLGRRVTVSPDGCFLVDNDPDHYARAGGMNAHRLVWESIHGPIGCSDHIHHKCRNPGCINPNHLERLTRQEHYEEHADDPTAPMVWPEDLT